MGKTRYAAIIFCWVVMTTLVSFSSSASAMGREYSDNTAPMFPMAFYDVNLQDGQAMADFLWVINETYDLMIAKGVPAWKIRFNVSLRGMSVMLASNSYIDNNGEVGAAIAEQLEGLKARGIRIEACDISLVWVGVPADDLVEGIVVIDNAFASSIYYQRRGYALIPIHQLP